MNDNIEITAKLKLDTNEAESKLSQISKKTGGSSKVELSLPKDTEIKLPKKTKESLAGLFSGPKGITNISNIAKGATGGIGGLLGSLQGLTAGAAGLTAALGAVTAGVVIILKLLQGTDTMLEIQRSLTRLVSSLRDVLAPVLALVGEVVIVLADAISELMPILEQPIAIIARALNQVVFALKVLEPFVEIIGKIIEVTNAVSSVFSELIDGAMTSLFEIIIELVNVALAPLFRMLDNFIEFIEKIKFSIQDFITTLTGGLITFNKMSLASTEAVKGGSKTSLDTWETAGGESATEKNSRLAAEAAKSSAEAASSLSFKINSFFKSLGEGLSSLFGGIGGSFKNVKDGIYAFFVDMAEGLRTDWENIKSVFNEGVKWINESVISPISNAFVNVWSGLKNGAKDAWEGVKSVFSKVRSLFIAVGGWFSTAWESIKEFFVNIGSAVGGLFSGIWQGIIEFFIPLVEIISEVFTNVWENIRNIFSIGIDWIEDRIIEPMKNAFISIWSGLTEGAKSAWEGVKSVFSKVGSFFIDTFSKAWSGIKSIFSDGGEVFVNIKDGVVKAFTAVVNSLIGGINKVVSVPFKSINKVLEWLRDISILGITPFSKIKTIAIPEIPKIKTYAEGGTLPRDSQIWGMSEKGNPEFLFNAGGHNTVINADILEKAMYNAVKKASVEKRSQTIEVSVKEGIASGPRELAQMLLPSLKFLLKGG